MVSNIFKDLDFSSTSPMPMNCDNLVNISSLAIPLFMSVRSTLRLIVIAFETRYCLESSH